MYTNYYMSKCLEFFNDLAESLSKTHEIIKSPNNDSTLYLVPKGTKDELSYYGKPANSYRVSDHWNWYASMKKCNRRNYIQCLNSDLPWAKKRKTKDGCSNPIYAAQVAYLAPDGKYHVIYGEAFNKKTKEWRWVDNV